MYFHIYDDKNYAIIYDGENIVDAAGKIFENKGKKIKIHNYNGEEVPKSFTSHREVIIWLATHCYKSKIEGHHSELFLGREIFPKITTYEGYGKEPHGNPGEWFTEVGGRSFICLGGNTWRALN